MTTVFEDLLSDEIVEELVPPEGVQLKLLGQIFAPTLLSFKLNYSGTEFHSIQCIVRLDNSEDIEHVRPLVEDFGYSVEDIKAHVFTRVSVTLMWRVKPEILGAHQDQLLPFTGWPQFARVQSAEGEALLLDLDQAYVFESLEL